MNKTIFITGLLLGALSVIIGAFATHGLESLLDAKALRTFETGVKYQMYHALFLLILGSVKQVPEASKKLVFYLLVAGVLLFSFSIYFLATNSLTDFDFKTIAFLTPIGGLFLISAWILLAYRSYQHFD